VILKDLLFDAVAFSAIKADKEFSIDEEKMELEGGWWSKKGMR
jgi:hypothetical protein